MKIIKDGNAIAVVKDNFINLQESPSVWFLKDSEIGKILLEDGIEGLPAGDLREIYALLSEEE